MEGFIKTILMAMIVGNWSCTCLSPELTFDFKMQLGLSHLAILANEHHSASIYHHLLKIWSKSLMVPTSIASQKPLAVRDSRSLLVYHLDSNADTINFIHLFERIANQVKEPVWLVDITKLKSIDNAVSLLCNVNVRLNSNLYLAMGLDSRKTRARIWEVYRIKKGMHLTVTHYADWYQVKGLTAIPSNIDKSLTKLKQVVFELNIVNGFKEDQAIIQPKWKRRRDLMGAHLRLQTLPSYSFVKKMTPTGNDGNYKMSGGVIPDIVDALQAIMNFTYTVRQPPDKKFGSMDHQGQWNGMVGQLADDQSDIAVTDLTVTEARSEVVDFSTAFVMSSRQLFIKNPTSSTWNYLTYLEPLDHLSWLAIGLLILVSPLVLYLTMIKGRSREEYESEFTLAKCFAIFVDALMLRGYSHTPSGLPSRTSFLVMYLGGSVLTYSWQATVTSFLTTKLSRLPFNSLSELASSTDYRVFVRPGSSSDNTFRMSQNPLYQTVWRERIEPYLEEYAGEKFRSTGAGFLTNTNARIASYSNSLGMISLEEFAKCQILAIPEKYETRPYAFGFQKNSSYLGIFNFYFDNLRETGALSKIKLKYMKTTQECPNTAGSPIGFDNCITAFCIVSLGLVMMLILIAAEHVYMLMLKNK